MTVDFAGLFLLLAGIPVGVYLAGQVAALPLPDLYSAAQRQRIQAFGGGAAGLTCAALAIASAPPGGQRLLQGLSFILLSLLAWSDLRTRTAPLWPAAALAILGLTKAYLALGAIGTGAFAGAGLTMLGFAFALREGFRMIRGHEGMGEADPPILAAMACWLGFPAIAWTCAIAAALGLCAQIFLNQRFGPKWPFITLLALAATFVSLATFYV